MSTYTVKQLAKLSGVSVRTLHHYDEIGLLAPATVGANGYRYYGREELLRLQQILFHRDLRLPLDEIGKLLDAPGFDRIAALKFHRERLLADARRYRRLARTIDETLAALTGETDMNDKAMYRGFNPEKQAEYEAQLVERFGGDTQARIDEAKVKMQGATQADLDRLKAEAEAIETGLADALGQGLPATSAPVQALMKRHHAWVGTMWGRNPSKAPFIGLGTLYQEHPDFRARYETRKSGLTDYFAEAMRVFAEAQLA